MGNLHSIKIFPRRLIKSSSSQELTSVPAVMSLRSHLEKNATKAELSEYDKPQGFSLPCLLVYPPPTAVKNNYSKNCVSVTKFTRSPQPSLQREINNGKASVPRQTAPPPGFPECSFSPEDSCIDHTSSLPETTESSTNLGILNHLPGCGPDFQTGKLGPLWEVKDSNGEMFNFNLPGIEPMHTKDRIQRKK